MKITHVDIITAEPSKWYPFAEVKPNTANGIHLQRLIMHDIITAEPSKQYPFAEVNYAWNISIFQPSAFNVNKYIWIHTSSWTSEVLKGLFATTFHVTICTKQKGQISIPDQQSLTMIFHLLEWLFIFFACSLKTGRALVGPPGRQIPWQKVGLTDWRDIL